MHEEGGDRGAQILGDAQGVPGVHRAIGEDNVGALHVLGPVVGVGPVHVGLGELGPVNVAALLQAELQGEHVPEGLVCGGALG